MVIFRAGSAPGCSMPSSACPLSWYAVRRRSSSGMTSGRSASSRTISRAAPLPPPDGEQRDGP